MTNAAKKTGGWSAVRHQLATWEKPALLALVKDLYEAAGVNRDFIHARCQAGESGGEALEKYRGKIVEQFFPTRGFGKLKLGEARGDFTISSQMSSGSWRRNSAIRNSLVPILPDNHRDLSSNCYRGQLGPSPCWR